MMPTALATCSAARRLSPVSSTGRRPELTEIGDGRGTRRLDGVGHDEQATHGAVPTNQHGGLPGSFGRLHRLSQLRVSVHRPVGEEPGPAGDDRTPADDSADTEPLRAGEAVDGKEVDATMACAGGDGLGNGVLGGILERCPDPQHLVIVREDVGERHRPRRDRAGLVEHDRVGARESTREPRVP